MDLMEAGNGPKPGHLGHPLALGLHVEQKGLNYPYFIGNQNLFYTFGPRMIPRAKGCPRWQLLVISGPPVVLGGHGLVPIIHLSLGIYSYSRLFDLESI